jgi:signal transduction histidine kinase
MHVTYESLAVARLLEGNEDEILVLIFLGAGMMLVTTLGISFWVIKPLSQLSRGLETGAIDPLQPLRNNPNEFGHLARLVEQSFSQRSALEHEVRERSRLAESLQETSGQLRESIELRNRLARDLHDSVIQSIYAAGLGLEGVRSLVHTDPAAAVQRLVASQAALNDTIRNVRAFINGLEAEAGEHRPFQQTVATLVATMKAIQPGHITVSIDESIARRINPAQELQLLHVLRESISNALRHADPGDIRVSLAADAGPGAVLTVADNGCGFDPAAPGGSGRGLVNLGIRAREMAGSLEIDSAPGKGTRITLRFNPTYPP